MSPLIIKANLTTVRDKASMFGIDINHLIGGLLGVIGYKAAISQFAPTSP